MKANIPRPWQALPPAQRKSIEDYCQRMAREAAIETTFIGNHRRLFKRQSRMVQDNTQIEYLNRRMDEIFKKNGFPQHFFDEMLGAVETPSGDQKGATDERN